MKKRVKDRDEGKKIKTENRTKENENSRSRNGGGGDGISRVLASVILCEPVNNRAKCAVSHLRQTLATTTVPRDPKDLCFRLTATAAAARVKILFNAPGFVFPPSTRIAVVSKLQSKSKTEKPVTRIRLNHAHNGLRPRYSKNPLIFMLPMRPVEAVVVRARLKLYITIMRIDVLECDRFRY